MVWRDQLSLHPLDELAARDQNAPPDSQVGNLARTGEALDAGAPNVVLAGNVGWSQKFEFTRAWHGPCVLPTGIE
jgi:hypothetical protein